MAILAELVSDRIRVELVDLRWRGTRPNTSLRQLFRGTPTNASVSSINEDLYHREHCRTTLRANVGYTGS
jgi:hypothetical protein